MNSNIDVIEESSDSLSVANNTSTENMQSRPSINKLPVNKKVSEIV